jgi:hypothetical protein
MSKPLTCCTIRVLPSVFQVRELNGTFFDGSRIGVAPLVRHELTEVDSSERPLRPTGGGSGGRCKVLNLPRGCGWQQLNDFCRQIGEVTFAHVNGSTGIAEFPNKNDLDRAVRVYFICFHWKFMADYIQRLFLCVHRFASSMVSNSMANMSLSCMRTSMTWELSPMLHDQSAAQVLLVRVATFRTHDTMDHPRQCCPSRARHSRRPRCHLRTGTRFPRTVMAQYNPVLPGYGDHNNLLRRGDQTGRRSI